MASLFPEQEPESEAELLAWWAAEHEDTSCVGSENDGERVQYVVRSREEIARNINFILECAARQPSQE
ncbi:MAG: hypothetical protein WCK65_04295 [Rhodospirillaceae bacterium]